MTARLPKYQFRLAHLNKIAEYRLGWGTLVMSGQILRLATFVELETDADANGAVLIDGRVGTFIPATRPLPC
jgi:hypothetical protein